MHNHAIAQFKELAGMGEDWKILFLTGGASTQFLMLPENMLYDGKGADYLVTGHWSKAAVKEAKRFGPLNLSSVEGEGGSFTRIPKQSELKLDPKAAYVHMTSNNTIFGSQWQYWPEVGKVPLVCDMFERRLLPALPRGEVRHGLRRRPEEPRPLRRHRRGHQGLLPRPGQGRPPHDDVLQDPRGQQLPLQHPALLLDLHPRPHPRLDQEDGRPGGHGEDQRREGRDPLRRDRRLRAASSRGRSRRSLARR